MYEICYHEMVLLLGVYENIMKLVIH